MLKKIFSCFLALVMCFLALPITELTALAATNTVYNTSQVLSYTQQFCEKYCTDKDFSVPTVNRQELVLINNDSFAYKNDLYTGLTKNNRVKVENNVTTIGIRTSSGQIAELNYLIGDSMYEGTCNFLGQIGNSYYYADIISLLYFINKLHTMYHCKESWAYIDMEEHFTPLHNGLSESFGIDSSVGSNTFESISTELFTNSSCHDPDCPLLNYLTIHKAHNNYSTRVSELYGFGDTDGELRLAALCALRNIDCYRYAAENGSNTQWFTTLEARLDPYREALKVNEGLAPNASQILKDIQNAAEDIESVANREDPAQPWIDMYKVWPQVDVKFMEDAPNIKHTTYYSYTKALFYYLEKVCNAAVSNDILNEEDNSSSAKALIEDDEYLYVFTQDVYNSLQYMDGWAISCGSNVPNTIGSLLGCFFSIPADFKTIWFDSAGHTRFALQMCVEAYNGIVRQHNYCVAAQNNKAETLAHLQLTTCAEQFNALYEGPAGVLAFLQIVNPDVTADDAYAIGSAYYETHLKGGLGDIIADNSYAEKYKTADSTGAAFKAAWLDPKGNKYKKLVKLFIDIWATDYVTSGNTFDTLLNGITDWKYYEICSGVDVDVFTDVSTLTVKQRFVQKLSAADCEYFSEKYYFLGMTDSLYKPSITYNKPSTAIMLNKLDELKVAYEEASTRSSGLYGPEFTNLKARADIIDFYAEYQLEEDEFITKIMDETKSNLGEGAVFIDYNSEGGSFAKCNPNMYSYTQTLLVREAHFYCSQITKALSTIQAGGSTTFEGASEEVRLLEDLHSVLTRYPGDTSDAAWHSLDCEITDAWKEQYGDRTLPTPAWFYMMFLQLGLLNNVTSDFEIFTKEDPLSRLWTITGGHILFDSDYYIGRALSATYIPMQDNLYDPYTMLDYTDFEFIEGFHYQYGFYRKALKIDTNTDAAVDKYTSGTTGETRVATLKDLMNPAKDIVLYVDTSFYNLTELAENQDKAYDRLANDPNVWREMWTSFTSLLGFMNEVDFNKIMKHGENVTYSYEVASNNSGLDYDAASVSDTEEKSYWNNETFYDDIILDKTQINNFLNKVEYTPMKGYALVSTIYRDPDTYNLIAEICAENKPVFVSSPTLWTLSGIDSNTRSCMYNYALLKNISDKTTVGYDTSLDMTSPLYIDVYGNISTESGTVVIPAAANATLHTSFTNAYQPINVGFLSTYGTNWSIPLDTNISEEFMEEFFLKNEEKGVWDIAAKTIHNVPMNFAQLSYSDIGTCTALMNWYKFDLVNGNQLEEELSLNIVHEVMRGAPLEYIDADEENLNPNREISRTGLVAAAKLDQFITSLHWDDDNSVTGMPNLSFIPNYQYIVTFVFKVLLVIIIIALMVTVYIDSVRQTISGKTILKCVSTLLVGVGSVLLIPTAFEISYYQSNKLLLQDEAGYIMLMNTEKNMSGREIGITEVTEPEQNTKIYLKLENYEFDWISVLPEVVFGDSVNALTNEYNEFLESSFVAGMDNVQCMNDGIYMDVQDIFDTSVVNFNTNSKNLYQKVSVEPVASYYLPYYYFLDAFITNMNDYNAEHNVYAYSTKIMRGGYVKTVNLCDAFFNSPTFMGEECDILGLRQLYGLESSVYISPIFADTSIDQAKGSQWYVGTLMDEEGLFKRVDIMHENVRRWVNDNKDIIGRITDETFLKVLAMEMAVEYNNLFGMPNATAYEIYDLSNADLMRLVVTDKSTTLEGSPMSFARFVYNEAGTPGVMAGMILTVVTLFTYFMRTIMTIAIMALLIISVYVFKILLRKSNNSVAGYFATLGVICATNVLYALVLKLSIFIPSTGLAPTICIILQILIQLAYLVVLGAVLIFALRDWRNFGFTNYQRMGAGIKEKFYSWRHRHGHGYGNGGGHNPLDDRPRGVNGWDYLSKLEENFKKKQKKVGK